MEKEEAQKEKIREKFKDMDLEELLMEWEEGFEQNIEDFEEHLRELKTYRASPNMFDRVPVPAYGEVYDLSELAQTIVRGESNLLVSVYDDSIKESVMKAIIVYDPELECSMEGKYISVRMASTRSENRGAILAQAKSMFLTFKSDLSQERAKAMRTMRQLQKVLPMDEIDIQKKELEELFKEYQDKGQTILDNKERDIMRK